MSAADEIRISKPPICARCLRRSPQTFSAVTEYRTLLFCTDCAGRRDAREWIEWFSRNHRRLVARGWVSLEKALLRKAEMS